MNWIEIVASSILVVLFFALAYDNLRTRFNIQKISRQLVQEKLDYDAIVVKLQEALKESDKKNVEGTEGFIKFLTESRESAFKYIEDFQLSLLKLKKNVDKLDIENSEVKNLHSLNKIIQDLLGYLPKGEDHE